MGFVQFSLQTAMISLNSINRLMFVVVKYDDLFEVRAELLNVIKTKFGFECLSNHFTVLNSFKPG
jgi:hypothetical protein